MGQYPQEEVDYFNPDDRQGLLGWYSGTVIESFWSTDRVQSKGKATWDGADDSKLFWLVRIDDVHQDYDQMVPPTMSAKMSIGKKWLPNEDGTFVEHEDAASDEEVAAGTAKPLYIKGSSMYGKFLGLTNGNYESYYTQTPVDPMVDEPVVLDDGPEPDYDLTGVRQEMNRLGRKDPRRADIWVGFQFEFRGLGFKYRQTKGTPGMNAVPVRFLGFDPEAHIDGSGAAGEAQSSNGSVDPASVSLSLPDDTEAGLVDDIVKLVEVSSSHTEFMKQALVLDGVKTNNGVKSAVMDAENGPWSKK